MIADDTTHQTIHDARARSGIFDLPNITDPALHQEQEADRRRQEADD